MWTKRKRLNTLRTTTIYCLIYLKFKIKPDISFGTTAVSSLLIDTLSITQNFSSSPVQRWCESYFWTCGSVLCQTEFFDLTNACSSSHHTVSLSITLTLIPFLRRVFIDHPCCVCFSSLSHPFIHSPQKQMCSVKAVLLANAARFHSVNTTN